jgi:hypothetical protein
MRENFVLTLIKISSSLGIAEGQSREVRKIDESSQWVESWNILQPKQ